MSANQRERREGRKEGRKEGRSAAQKKTDLTLFSALRFYKLIDFSDSLRVDLNNLSESTIIYSLNYSHNETQKLK